MDAEKKLGDQTGTMQIEVSLNTRNSLYSRWGNTQKRDHRRKGKSFTSWYNNGQKWHESYYINGKYHNTKGPAYTSWYSNGQKAYEEYYVNGKRHNTKGPATTSWYSNGQKDYVEYYINGGYLTKGQWETRCKLN